MTTDNNPEDTELTKSFLDFGLDDRILDGLTSMGFERPTPIQAEAIPYLLEGKDIIGRARTGSGKTAAFAIPLLERIKEGGAKPRALVLSPTRELAIQIGEAIRNHAAQLSKVHGITIYGGAPYPPQIKALKKGCSVVVGTPGRVIDLMERGALDLSEIELFVLDEADEMLRMGFIEDVERLLEETPSDRQVALFSATMPAPIRRVASRTLHDPIEVQVEERALSVDHIDQRWLMVPQSHKLEALCRILQGTQRGATLVFAKTRASCMEVADAMAKRGFAADALHGDLGQGARERVLRRFRSGNLKLLIATDVAARGLDVDHLSHVVNLDLPNNKESYVHRIGRTGRAGRAGIAISLATPSQTRFIRRLEHSLGITMARVQVPSDAQIAKLQRSHLANQIGGNESVSTDAQRWLTELMDTNEWTMDEVAARALELLATRDGVSLSNDQETSAPAWARKNARRLDRERAKGPKKERSADELAAFAQTNEVQLFIALGRRHGTRPQDIVGALANEMGISGKQIGRIHIAEGSTFVGLPKAVASGILQENDTLLVRGMDVTIDLCKTKPPAKESDGKSFRPGPRRRKPSRSGGPRKWGERQGGRPPKRNGSGKAGGWKIKSRANR